MVYSYSQGVEIPIGPRYMDGGLGVLGSCQIRGGARGHARWS